MSTYCGECGRSNPDEKKFCWGCGTILHSEKRSDDDYKSHDSSDRETDTSRLAPNPDEEIGFPALRLHPSTRKEWEEFYLLGRDLSQGRIKEMEQIWGKWRNITVPPTIQEKCSELMQPLRYRLFIAQEDTLKRSSPNLTTKNYEDLGEVTGTLLVNLCKSCLFVGLEHGHRLWMIETSQVAIDLVRVACTPIFDFMSTFYTQSSASDSEALEMAWSIGKAVRLLGINCCIVGMDWASTMTAPSLSIVPTAKPLQRTNTPVEGINQSKIITQYCESCGNVAPIWYVRFYQIIGAVILVSEKSIKGRFCKECINQYFWTYTLKTLILGWWGVIAFIMTPLALVNNIIRYIGTLILPSTQNEFIGVDGTSGSSGISAEQWIVICILLFCVACVFYSLFVLMSHPITR